MTLPEAKVPDPIRQAYDELAESLISAYIRPIRHAKFARTIFAFVTQQRARARAEAFEEAALAVEGLADIERRKVLIERKESYSNANEIARVFEKDAECYEGAARFIRARAAQEAKS